MKRRLSILLALAMLLSLCTVGVHAAENDTITAAGFYGIEASNKVSVTPAASTGTVEKVSANVDGKEGYEEFHANSDKLTVSFEGKADQQYLVLLMEGKDATPTASNICYIDQTAADSSGAVSFDVFPKLDAMTASGPMTLMITSTDTTFGNNGIQKISLAYAPSGEYEKQPFIRGDVDGNGVVAVGDATRLLQHLAQIEGKLLTGAGLLAADTDKNGVVAVGDATRLLQHLAQIEGKEIVQ